ncbi:MAG: hypothetical protein ACREBI_02460 [Nitrosotalea sp.]
MSAIGKSLGNKVVLAKIPREEFSEFQRYCEHNGETINSSLRRMIQSEIGNPHPSKIAGKSVFQYNKNKDNFSWKVVLDDGASFSIDDDLPANSVEQLLESIMKAAEERNSFIKKTNIDSVSFPNKLVRKKK